MTPTPDPTFEPGRRVRFGLFDFNLATLALKRDGQLVNIQQQPALVLQYLVLRADRVVSREELQKAIWPSGTFVEFDFGLNTAINRIRRALGDSAGEPRYIETIPRQGYRFMVPVQHVLPVADNHPNPPGAVPVSAVPVSKPPPLPMPAAYRPRVKLAAGAALILLAAGPLWLYLRRPEPSPMLEGRAFTTMPGEENRPVLSPDGTVVAFDKASAGGVQIWLQRADADSPQQLTTAPGIQRTAAWSPEGGRLAFIRQLPNHAAGIFSVPVPGTGEQKWAELPQGFDDLPHLDWSPDGQTFLSGQRDSATGPSYLVSVSLANGEKRKLTSPPPGELGDSFGMFSPDGRRIAFRRTRSNGVEDVWLIPSTGGEARRVTFDNRGISGIAWAANGGSLILSSRRTSTLRNLWRLWLDRGTMERLQPASVDAGSPAVSRRGRRLVYVVSAIDIDCWRFPTGGGTPERIVSSTAGESSPQFSPDGSRIAFVSDRSGTSEIWIANSDGSAPLRLTNSGATGAGGAQWSPDGRYLTFNASPDHNNDVFVISAGSKELRRITAEPSNESAPSWSRDGKWIYFSSNRSGTPSIWRAPAAGGPAERVTTALSGFPLESPDGKFIYYARQSSSCSVLRQPLNPSGSEEKVFDYPGRILGNYTLGAQGIYFICVDSHDEAGLWYHDLALGTRRLLHTLTKSPVAGAAGMSLSSDGRWVSYAEVEHSTRDIYLVDNFR